MEDIRKTSNAQPAFARLLVAGAERPTLNCDYAAVAAVCKARRCWHSAAIEECRAINLSARLVNSRPGEILCHGDAPEGCGNGTKSKRCPARSTRNVWPITFSNFGQSMNCMMASRPTGMMRRGRKIRISLSIHDEQLRISSGAGRRSVPLEFLPGKQRQTAAK
jgi:hypothetical protein